MTPDIKYSPSIIVGRHIEQYNTPPGKLVSSVIKDEAGNGKVIRQARFMVSNAGDVTVIDAMNGLAIVIPVNANIEYRFPVSQITAHSVPGTIFTIFHDGDVVN